VNSATRSGVFNIDKPAGITSHDVVNRVRRIAGTRRVGHAGTLDPAATGVLVVCINSATRLSEYLMATAKRYRAEVHLGRETTTYDADGEIVAEQSVSHLSDSAIREALSRFVGTMEQIPPIYSAIRQGGRKLYELAREGRQVTPQARTVTIEQIELLAWRPPIATLDIICGHGTYIRSIAHDLGAQLGIGGSLSGLVREASGRFLRSDAVPLGELEASQEPWRWLISPRQALTGFPMITVTDDEETALRKGKAIPAADHLLPSEGPIFAQTAGGDLAAVLYGDGDNLRPHKVFSTSE